MDKNIINELSKLTLEGKITFPQMVGKLINLGIERYRADLIMLRKAFFGIQDEVHTTDILLINPSAVASLFNEFGIKSAIKDAQQNLIDYQKFLNFIITAGCTHYEVFLTGKKVIYFGRKGSFHIEHFPS